MKMFEVILDELVGISIHGFELVGVVIIILSGGRSPRGSVD